MVGLIRSEPSAAAISGDAPEIGDPLEALTPDNINDQQGYAFDLLLNLLHRLPKDIKPDVASALLGVAWNLVIRYKAKERLLPFRAEYYRPHKAGNNTAANSNTSNSSKVNTTINQANRNMDGHWRSKASKGPIQWPLRGTSPEKLSSEPPPLPAYQKNLFAYRDQNGNMDFHKANPGKLHPSWNVTTPEAPKATRSDSIPNSAGREMYSNDDMVAPKLERSRSAGWTLSAATAPSTPMAGYATKSPRKTTTPTRYSTPQKKKSPGRYLVASKEFDDNNPDIKWSSDEQEEAKPKATPKKHSFSIANEEAVINNPLPRPPLVKTVQFDPDEISPVNTLSTKHVRPGANGAFLIPQFDNVNLHDDEPNGTNMVDCDRSPVVVAAARKPRSKSVTSNSDFDWTTETEGCRESFDDQFVIQLAYGKVPLPKEGSDEEVSASADRLRQQHIPVVEVGKKKPTSKPNTFNSLRSQLTVGSTARVKKVDEVEMPRNRRPSSSSFRRSTSSARGSPAAKYNSPEPDAYDDEKEAAKEDLEEEDRFAEHKKFCVICTTYDHTTVDCPETPPAKVTRIRALNLCKKCLSPHHVGPDCWRFGKVVCVTCGLDHLDYIYHKPDDWIFKQYGVASTSTGQLRRQSQSSNASMRSDLAKDGDGDEGDVPQSKGSHSSTPLPSANNIVTELKDLLGDLSDCSAIPTARPVSRVTDSPYLISFEDDSSID